MAEVARTRLVSDAFNSVERLARWASRTIPWVRRRIPRGLPERSPGVDAWKLGPLSPPRDRLPNGGSDGIRGRDQIKQQLREALKRPPPHTLVLTGMPGVGKTTLGVFVTEVAMRLPGMRRQVWWVSAVDRSSFLDGMASVARERRATEADLDAIVSGANDGPLRLRRLLVECPDWVLVLDNLDDPEVLLPRGDWLSLSTLPGGLVVVTTRCLDEWIWGGHADLQRVKPLAEDDAAQVLQDLAPEAGDAAAARALARRLGYLPVGLQVMGRLLSLPLSEWSSFTALGEALDGPDRARVLAADVPGSDGDPRLMPTRTFDLPLDTLRRNGLPEARPLLAFLSCFAAATPLPFKVLQACTPPAWLAPSTSGSGDERLRRALRGLSDVGLVGVDQPADETSWQGAVIVHPLIADVNRACLDSVADPAVEDSLDPVTIRSGAVECLAVALRDFAGIGVLDANRRNEFRLLTTHLRELLRCSPEAFAATHSACLVATTAAASEVYIDDRDEKTGEDLAKAAQPHADLLSADDHSVLQLRHTLGHAAVQLGRPEEAERLLRTVYEDRVRVLALGHSDCFESRRWLAWSLEKQDRLAEAETEFRQLLHDMECTPNVDEEQELHVRCMFSWVLCRLGRWDEAVVSYERVIAGREGVLRARHPDTLDARHSLGRVLLDKGDARRAHVAFCHVLVDREHELGPDHPDTLESRKYTTLAAQRLGGCLRSGRARKELARIYAVQKDRLGSDHPYTLETGHLLGGR